MEHNRAGWVGIRKLIPLPGESRRINLPFQSVPGGIEATVMFRLDNQVVENVLHFDNDLPPDLAKLQAVAEMVAAWVADNYIAPLSTSLSFFQVTAKSLVNQFDFVYDMPINPTIEGSATGNAMPNEVALCMSLRTGLAGQSERGRAYVPGIPVASVTQNLVSGTFASNMLAAWNELIIAAPAAGVTWAVLSRETAGAPRANGVLFEITSVTLVDLYVDSQRRRKPGNGT